MLSKVKGSTEFINQSNAYIDSTAVVKKCNFKKYLTHENYKTAALTLKEASISKSAPAVSTTKDFIAHYDSKNIGSTVFAARTKVLVSSLQLRKWKFI